MSDSLPEPADVKPIGVENTLRQKTHFTSQFKWIVPFSPPAPKYFFRFIGIYDLLSPSRLTRGALRGRHGR
jgi:hypothetical protein